MEFFEGFIIMPAITVIVYFLVEVYKALIKNKENGTRFLPLLCGGAGAILAIISYYAFPSTVPADNLFAAIATGIVSGFAATGAHQVYKQLLCKNNNEKQ